MLRTSDKLSNLHPRFPAASITTSYRQPFPHLCHICCCYDGLCVSARVRRECPEVAVPIQPPEASSHREPASAHAHYHGATQPGGAGGSGLLPPGAFSHTGRERPVGLKVDQLVVSNYGEVRGDETGIYMEIGRGQDELKSNTRGE